MSYRRKNGTGGITKMSGKRNNPYRVRITETFVVDPFIRTQGEKEELIQRKFVRVGEVV